MEETPKDHKEAMDKLLKLVAQATANQIRRMVESKTPPTPGQSESLPPR